MKEYNKYDNKIEDVDEVLGTDIKIHPDYYIHHAIRQSQLALAGKDFTIYRLHTENIERLAKAAKMLGDDYETKLTKYKKSDKYKKEKDSSIQNLKLEEFKQEILLEEIFSSKTITGTLKL